MSRLEDGKGLCSRLEKNCRVEMDIRQDVSEGAVAEIAWRVGGLQGFEWWWQHRHLASGEV